MSKVLNRFGVPLPLSTRKMMGQPKPKHRFRVIFFGLSGPEIWSEDGGIVTYETNSVTRPKLTFDTHEVHHFDGVANMSGKRRWGDVTLTIKDTVDNGPLKSIAKQAQKQSDFYRRISPLSTVGGYKFEMWIQTLNGNEDGAAPDPDQVSDAYIQSSSNPSALHEMFKGTLDTFACLGCMVSEYDFGDLDYSDSNFSNISLSIKVDNCAILDSAGNLFSAGDEFSTGSSADFADKILKDSVTGSISNALKQQYEGFKSELFGDITEMGIGVANSIAGDISKSISDGIGGLF